MWQIRCAANTLKTLIPFERKIGRLRRKILRIPHAINESSVYSGAFDQIEHLGALGVRISGARILEVGTGWYPVIPLMLRVAGAGSIVLTDAHRLLDLDNLRAAIAFVRARKADISKRLGITSDAIEARLAIPDGVDLGGALEALQMTYAAPYDYANTVEEFDIIYSHTVLEHIPRDALEVLLRQWRRALKPGGVISHGIDHSDHREHSDPRLSRIDFLRYSDRVWGLISLHPTDYTSRLRHPDYTELFRNAGFELILERVSVDPKCLTDLESWKVDDRFKRFSKEELATLWSHLVARPLRTS